MEAKKDADAIRQVITFVLEGYLDHCRAVSMEEAARALIAERYGVPVSAVEVNLESGTASVKPPAPCECLQFTINT